ncbi:MAG: Secretion system C-terminal sorting domain [Cytophagaceae bacterium]|nr:Secretion system C-terminal sorting domain [Cytophagaceae bacterium]
MKINYSSDSYSPTQDSFRTIDFFEKKLKGICTIKLYNPEGKLIAQDVVNAAHHRVFIRVKGLKAGVHTIEVINEGKIYWKKFEVMKEE